MKLTPVRVKQLSWHLEKNLNEMGCKYVPMDYTIAAIIADWCKSQMETEAANFHAKVTAQ